MKEKKGELKYEKFKTDGRVICTSCGQFSGWTNDELIYIKGDRKLKCNNCGIVCIEIYGKFEHDRDKVIRDVRMEMERNAELIRKKFTYEHQKNL